MTKIELEAKSVLTTRDFDTEDGKNVLWYQALRLYNEGLEPMKFDGLGIQKPNIED